MDVRSGPPHPCETAPSPLHVRCILHRRCARATVHVAGRPRQETTMFRNRGGGDDVPADVFIMREKLASIGDDFWIENGAGQKVYKVDGKAVRVRDTLVLEDMNRQEVATIKEKLVSVRDVMTIERG